MFETHRVRADRSDVYNAEYSPAANAPAERSHGGDSRGNLDNGYETGLVDREDDGDDRGTYPNTATDDEGEWADAQWYTFLVRPNRPIKSRNQPGQQTAAMRGR